MTGIHEQLRKSLNQKRKQSFLILQNKCPKDEANIPMGYLIHPNKLNRDMHQNDIYKFSFCKDC